MVKFEKCKFTNHMQDIIDTMKSDFEFLTELRELMRIEKEEEEKNSVN